MRVGAGADRDAEPLARDDRRHAPRGVPPCRRTRSSPPKYIASCTVQPTPSAFIRFSDASDASFKCAIDQRSGAIGTSWFTRSKMPSR